MERSTPTPLSCIDERKKEIFASTSARQCVRPFVHSSSSPSSSSSLVCFFHVASMLICDDEIFSRRKKKTNGGARNEMVRP